MRKIIKREPAVDPAACIRVASEISATGVTPVLARVLATRGVTSADEAAGRYKLLHYRSMRNIGDAAKLLATCIRNHDPITVCGDFDTDGCTASTIAVRGLRALGADVDFIVPNRRSEEHTSELQSPVHLVCRLLLE